MSTAPNFEQTKQNLLDQVEELTSQIENDQGNSHDLYDRYNQQNNLYHESTDNDDGNEDHPTTYNEDAENIQGEDRAEELTQIEEFQESTEHSLKTLETLAESIEKTEDPTLLEDFQDQINEIESKHKDASGYGWHSELGQQNTQAEFNPDDLEDEDYEAD